MEWVTGIMSGVTAAGTIIAVIMTARRAIREIIEAVRVVQNLVEKYRSIAMSDEARADLDAVSVALDEALEAVADTIQPLGMRKLATLLRNAIRPRGTREEIRRRVITENPLLQIKPGGDA